MAAVARRSFPPPPNAARALVLRAHPSSDSFNHALADQWVKGAREGGLSVEVIDIESLDFDPRLHVAYREQQPLEPDLQRVQRAVAEAAHLVLAFPIWWGSTPAGLKGLIDRVFLPGWAFRYDEQHRPVKGLTGRTARMLVTMDAPTWYDRVVYAASARRQVGRATLGFSGYSPVRQSAFGSVGTSTPAQRDRMLVSARRAGEMDAAAVRRGFPVPRRPEPSA